ncbi:MAG: protein-L-isoaspartate(D-aspartate) O-methyltransferase [Alphaproteobacteria bacterium]
MPSGPVPSADLADVRRRYAEHVTHVAGARDPRLLEAFAGVPRELFIGPPPWLYWGERGYQPVADSDPARLYDDIVVALRPDDGINNGQPSLHAACLAALAVRHGDRVLHVGCGTGYYSAILAELAGPEGWVAAYDLVPELVGAARRNLEPWPTAVVERRSACLPPLPRSDAIYVCAGATRPLAAWLDALRPGGRLVFPLTGRDGWGVVVRIERDGERWWARVVSRCGYVDCVDARDDDEARRLSQALVTPMLPKLLSLRRDTAPDTSCWVAGDGWWLSTDPPPE